MEQSELLKHLINSFESLGIRYFVTGSIASIFYGEPRFTNDIDVVAEVKEHHIPELLKLFPFDEFYINEGAIRNAIKHNYQFNIIHPSSGLKIDVIISKKEPFNDSRFERIKRISPIENEIANFASPEDVIIMKMIYYKEGKSEKHLRDITGILKISGDVIDRKYIEKWIGKLGIEDIWKSIIEKLEK
jgi:hypothetical protein